ncbi:hypothetical protein Pelo_1133 [Pelomyxa schiedti]|nr:hypothetical protein Pelo_1133 [Pelomyxa schiedti]
MSRVVGDEYLVTVVLGCINNGVDSCRASHVCKKWRQLCDEDFYKEKCKEKFSGKTTGVYSSWKHMFVDGNKKNLSSRVRSLNRCARVDCACFVPVDSAIGSIGNMHSVQYAGVFHSMALACTRLRAMLSSY